MMSIDNQRQAAIEHSAGIGIKTREEWLDELE
jgi:hypothetical protein